MRPTTVTSPCNLAHSQQPNVCSSHVDPITHVSRGCPVASSPRGQSKQSVPGEAQHENIPSSPAPEALLFTASLYSFTSLTCSVLEPPLPLSSAPTSDDPIRGPLAGPFLAASSLASSNRATQDSTLELPNAFAAAYSSSSLQLPSSSVSCTTTDPPRLLSRTPLPR